MKIKALCLASVLFAICLYGNQVKAEDVIVYGAEENTQSNVIENQQAVPEELNAISGVEKPAVNFINVSRVSVKERLLNRISLMKKRVAFFKNKTKYEKIKISIESENVISE